MNLLKQQVLQKQWFIEVIVQFYKLIYQNSHRKKDLRLILSENHISKIQKMSIN